MEYITNNVKNGIKVHYIKNNLFKTNLISIFITKKLSKDSVTKNTLIPAVLRRGTKNMPTQDEISKTLEELYGAEFNCGVDKTGDNHVLKFYIESLSNKYIISDEDLLKESIEKILEIIFDPILENGNFKKEYVDAEKEKIKQLIASKIDSKDKYAIDRCVEELYKDKEYGLYKYGYLEDVDNITSENLYEHYQNLIKTAKIDIFVSGEFEQSNVEGIINENQYIINLPERDPDYVINNETTEIKEKVEEKVITEKMDIGQGKLVMALDVFENKENSRYAISLYNIILGGSPNSKMFQNVREKESLAYSIGTVYLRTKNNIFLRAGIEIENYEKTVELVKKQIEDTKNGDFTDDDIEKAKKFMIYGIKSIIEDQEVGITYYIGQELSGSCVSPDEYLKNINSVNKHDIINVANKIGVNTIYFLTNEEFEK